MSISGNLCKICLETNLLLNLSRNVLKSVDMSKKKSLEALGSCLHFVACISASGFAMTTTEPASDG